MVGFVRLVIIDMWVYCKQLKECRVVYYEVARFPPPKKAAAKDAGVLKEEYAADGK